MFTNERSTAVQLGLGLDGETFQVVLLRLAFDVDDGENLVRVELTDFHHVIIEVGVEVEARNLELAVAKDLQDLILAFESTQILSAFVDIQATHGVVEPNVTSIERGDTFPTLLDFLDLVLREQVATRVTAFNS